MVHENGLERSMIDAGKGLLWEKDIRLNGRTVGLFKVIGTGYLVYLEKDQMTPMASVDSPSDNIKNWDEWTYNRE